MYTVERKLAVIKVDEYIRDFMDKEKFLGYCKQCKNYNNRWSCPEYDFDTYEYLRRYNTLGIIGEMIIYDKDLVKDGYSDEELKKIFEESFFKERKALDEELIEREKILTGTALFAGSCIKCKECQRAIGKECLYPEDIRYSLESLGGDVTRTSEELLGIKMKWAKAGELPEYHTLVAGFLFNC